MGLPGLRFYTALVASTLVSASALAAFQPFSGSATWQNAQQLPQYDQWSSMYSDAQEIADDLNNGGGKYMLQYKKPGGSSHQTLVVRVADRKVMGIWSAPNHATYIEGEIFAFHLARLFDRSQWVTPGVRMTLSGQGLNAARAAYSSADTPKARLCNQAHILSYMNENPYYITGVYKAFVSGTKPQDIPEIVDRKNQKRLDPSHFIVAMTSSSGQQPRGIPVYLSANKSLSYTPRSSDIGRSTDTELSKQVSFMALVDALNSQRDRFGPYGSNLESMLDSRTKTFAISAVDNGGIADSAKTISLKYFLESTSRFERDVLVRVLELDAFIKGQRSSFMQFQSVAEFKSALGIESELSQDSFFAGSNSRVCRDKYPQLYAAYGKRMELRWRNFVAALDLVAKKMKQLEYDRSAFFD
jgi:hypothetical protein